VSLPTPEQERKAIAMLLTWLFLGIIGIASVTVLGALAIIGIARWVWEALS
jgi:hypothetical protein